MTSLGALSGVHGIVGSRAQAIYRQFRSIVLGALGASRYICPICEFHGAFLTYSPPTGPRQHAMCPRCGALERHRMQWAAAERFVAATMRVLHIAPEPFIGALLRPRVGSYVTADLQMPGVDHTVDITRMPFGDSSFDLVWASHVLEHVGDDEAALSEIQRVLVTGGIAVLAVPVNGDTTVEYAAPNPAEAYHVRSPGRDYFDRYVRFFAEVRVFASEDVRPEFQPFVYEDRTRWAGQTLRPCEAGERHRDYVPICIK